MSDDRPDVQAGPVVTIAKTLSEIADLYAALLVQAIHKANDQLMPGGHAMVALASVGSPEEWAELVGYAELQHIATCNRYDHTRCRYAEHVADEDGTEPPLQTLLFWSEQWRAQHGYTLERRPTMTTEVNFIRGTLNWAWENEIHWDAFAADIRATKTRLENLLYAGERAERGVPCLYDECRGARLVKKLEPCRAEGGGKGWRFTDWHCPKCKRTWTDENYAAMVTAANEAAKVEHIDGEAWCTVDYAARHVGRPEATIRVWLHRSSDPDDSGHPIATACIVKGRRTRFVRLADVVKRHEHAQRKTTAA